MIRRFREVKSGAALVLLLASLGFAVIDANAQARRPVSTAPAARFFRVGTGPGSVAIADLNGDRSADIIVANEISDDVTIMLGDGRGGFVQPEGSPFPAGNSPNDIAIGDFNEDDIFDLAFPNHETDHVTVLLGDGQGAFVPAQNSPFKVLSRPHPHGIAAGDFNADGHPDLVVESSMEDRLEILLGDGAGGFTRDVRTISTGRMPYQKLRAADVNLDERADLITTNLHGNSVSVLLADSTGNFVAAPGSPIAAGRSPFSIAAGDVNADGNPDLVVVNYSGNANDPSRDSLTVLLGDGAGGFAPARRSPFRTGKAPVAVALGDVNGDRILDIAVANLRSNDVTIYLGDRTSMVKADGSPFRVGRKPEGIALGDLNRDGKADIVTANSADNNIAIILSR